MEFPTLKTQNRLTKRRTKERRKGTNTKVSRHLFLGKNTVPSTLGTTIRGSSMSAFHSS